MEPIVDSYLSESFLGFQFATSFSMELVTETDNEVDVGDHSQITSPRIGALTFVVQVAEKTEAFMEDSRRLATTAARLEQNKEEVARQVYTALAYLCVTLCNSRLRG